MTTPAAHEIDGYLEEVPVAIDDLGGRVDLVGLCRGSWFCAPQHTSMTT